MNLCFQKLCAGSVHHMDVAWMVILGMSMPPMARVCAHTEKVQEFLEIDPRNWLNLGSWLSRNGAMRTPTRGGLGHLPLSAVYIADRLR